MVPDEGAAEDDVPQAILLRREAANVTHVVGDHAQQRQRHVVRAVVSAHGDRGGARLGETDEADEMGELPSRVLKYGVKY